MKEFIKKEYVKPNLQEITLVLQDIILESGVEKSGSVLDLGTNIDITI